MSVTFEAILIPQLGEREAIEALNRALYFRDTARHQQFNKIDMDGAGGSKSFTTDIYAACFNHLIPDEVEDCIAEAPWRYPDWVFYIRDSGDYHMPDYGDPPQSMSAMTVSQLRADRAAPPRTLRNPKEDNDG